MDVIQHLKFRKLKSIQILVEFIAVTSLLSENELTDVKVLYLPLNRVQKVPSEGEGDPVLSIVDINLKAICLYPKILRFY